MSSKENNSKEKNPQTCMGLKDMIHPKPAYINCHVCGAEMEVWSDEDKATCSECGAEWKRPEKNASCLDYCEHADKCREIINSRRR